MAGTMGTMVRPRYTFHDETEAYQTPPEERLERTGVSIATIGLLVAGVVFATGFIAANAILDGDAIRASELDAGMFGFATAALATAKIGIAIVLVGIVRRVWLRIDVIKEALPRMRDTAKAAMAQPYLGVSADRIVESTVAQRPLAVQRMAQALWLPMLVMGGMLVYAGVVVSLLQSGNVATDATLAASQGAWVQGLQFLGEGMLLASVAFLLGTILRALRVGGGEIQQDIGVTVRTLRMPATGKAFIGLMLLGVMIEVAQFIGYVAVAGMTDLGTISIASAWLAPLREMGLGILLAGIVLALATIGHVLGFQFDRFREILTGTAGEV